MKIEEELQSRFRNEYHKLMVNLILTSTRIEEKFDEIISQYSITATQFNVLRILRGQQKKPVTVSLVKERMIERNSDVSRIIERLVQKGLIKRTENQSDRRQKDVIITQAGLKLLNKIDSCESEMDQLLQALSKEEAKSLNNLLDKLRSSTYLC